MQGKTKILRVRHKRQLEIQKARKRAGTVAKKAMNKHLK